METKKCNFCKTDIPKDAKVCPNCKKDIRNWFVKHWIITWFIVMFILWSIMQWFEDAKNNSNQNIVIKKEFWNSNIDYWITASSIDEIINSKYKSFFNSKWLNFELEKRIQDEIWKGEIVVLRAKFFTSDDKSQILVNTVYTVDWKEYASNSRHNIETNKIEDFYYSEVK